MLAKDNGTAKRKQATTLQGCALGDILLAALTIAGQAKLSKLLPAHISHVAVLAHILWATLPRSDSCCALLHQEQVLKFINCRKQSLRGHPVILLLHVRSFCLSQQFFKLLATSVH